MERVGIHRGLVVIAGLHRGRLSECRRALPGKLCYFLALSRPKEGPRLSGHLRLLPTFPRRAFVASEARAGVAVHFTLAEESYPNHIAMPYRQWTTRPTLHRSRARDYPSTTTDTPPPAPRPPRPSSRPPWPKQTTTRSGTASPTSESRCGAWEAWRCVPRLGPVGFSRNPRASGSIARRGEGASSPVSFRARSSPHRASSLSARYADRLLRRRHHLPRQEGEGREGGQEVTGPDANGQPARRAAKRHTTSRDEAGARLKLRARRRAVSARGPSAAIRDGR